MNGYSYGYGVDLSYLIYVIPPLIFALWAQFRVKSAFAKYSKVPSERGVIRLSQSTYDARTAAAVGVAAHEAGHAAQYAAQYFPIRIRAAIIPATRIGSNLAFPLVMLGFLFSFQPLVYIGIAFFGLAVLFQLVTLPVELDASRRALVCLRDAGLSDESVTAAKKVLTAAALTYVAALASAIGNFLRLLSIANRGKRR